MPELGSRTSLDLSLDLQLKFAAKIRKISERHDIFSYYLHKIPIFMEKNKRICFFMYLLYL